ncbi:MAG: zinc ribbon domain-containing protein [Halobacteriota archaeon]
MFCSKCGKKLPDGVAFCPNCGTSVSIVDQDTKDTAEKLIDEKYSNQWVLMGAFGLFLGLFVANFSLGLGILIALAGVAGIIHGYGTSVRKWPFG